MNRVGALFTGIAVASSLTLGAIVVGALEGVRHPSELVVSSAASITSPELEPAIVAEVRDRWRAGESNGPRCDYLLSSWGYCGDDCARLLEECEAERLDAIAERLELEARPHLASMAVASTSSAIPLTRISRPDLAACSATASHQWNRAINTLKCRGAYPAVWRLPDGHAVAVWPPVDRWHAVDNPDGNNLQMEVTSVSAYPCAQDPTGWCTTYEARRVE